MNLKPGTLLQSGKYRIEKVLGQGSFGITYLATTKIKVGGNLGKMDTIANVAIKEFFMRDLNGREGGTVTHSGNGELFADYKSKFVKEAIKLSELNHPNIIKVLDLFEENNTSYYVMEYCSGGSLDNKIKRENGLNEKESVRYAMQTGMALKYMHSKKMLHLDLKPGNVVLNDKGDAVLIDFGLSKQFDSNGEPESSTTIGLGTPGYAPIEQSNYDGKGFPVTMDVYAMGATLYKMLTGETPQTAPVLFNSGFPYEKLREKNVSEDLIAIISKAMKPMLLERCQSIEEFLKALEIDGEKTDVIVPEPPAPKFNKKWIWRIICLSCVLFHVFTLVFYFTDGGATSSPFYPHELLFVMLALTMILALVSLFKMGIKTKSKIKDRIIKTVLLLALLSGGGFMLWITFFEMDYYVYRGDEVWGRRTLAYDKDDFWDHRYKDNLIPIYKRSKGGYGLVNGLTAEVVIPYRYDFMREDDISSDCKFIGVELSDKWGVIDRKGNVIIPCVYDNVSARYLSVYGVSYVEKAGKCGLINTDGDVILPIVYDCMELNEQTKTIKICKDEKYGFVNLNGKIIIPLEYDYIVDFKEGRARVKVDGKWGFIDKNNNMVIPCKYKWVSDFNGGQASVETFAGEEYKIDKQGWRI